MTNGTPFPTSSRVPDEDFGLLANGSSGAWEVSIDETITGLEQWFAQIEGPSMSLYFEIPSLDVVPKAVRFLRPLTKGEGAPHKNSMGDGELVLSKPDQTPVLLVRDDEFDDRCFVIVGESDRPAVRFSLTGTDLNDILEALHQIEKGVSRRALSEKKTK